jgi:4-amino-4-deoxy-L-arabinose transferase-like glycosyltransferase
MANSLVGRTRWTRAARWRGWTWVLLGLVVAAYLWAELPYLDQYPLFNYDEGEIMAPAYKLVTRGILGTDLLTGFYRAEAHLYYLMPLYPLLMGAVFRVLGAGIWQARLLSVLSGLAGVLLTFVLGWYLHDRAVGLMAAAVLCLLQLGLSSSNSGLPFVDIARVARNDILVPVWGLLGSLCFLWAHDRGARWAYLASGACFTLAALSNAFGALFLPFFVVCLLWADGLAALRRLPLYLILLGCLLAGLPWLLYVSRDVAGFVGQMTIQSSRNRLDFFSPAFYWQNLISERFHYASWVGDHFSRPRLWPRAGIWVLALAVPTAIVLLARRLWRERRLADIFTFVSLPLLALLLALTTNLKIYGYLALVMPFLALQVAFGIVGLWRALGRARPAPRAAMAVGLALALIEGQMGVIRNLQTARSVTSYEQLMAPIAASLTPGARVLATHAFWLGLRPAMVLSLNLPFYFSNPGYGAERMPLPVAMAQLKPDYILADFIVGPNILLLAAQDDPWLEADFWRYVGQHCHVALALPHTDYGPFTLYQCAN